MKFINRLKEKWEIESTLSIILILVVFSLAGTSILKVGHFAYDWIGLQPDSAWYCRVCFWLLFFFPCYQLLLILYSIPLGQFRFFWNKQKKLGNWFLRLTRLRAGNS